MTLPTAGFADVPEPRPAPVETAAPTQDSRPDRPGAPAPPGGRGAGRAGSAPAPDLGPGGDAGWPDPAPGRDASWSDAVPAGGPDRGPEGDASWPDPAPGGDAGAGSARPGGGPSAAPRADAGRVADGDAWPDPVPGGGAGLTSGTRAGGPRADRGIPPAPVRGPATSGQGRRPAPSGSRPRTGERPPGRGNPGSATDIGRLAPVYDIDGPRVRLGVGWFLLAVPAVLASAVTASVVYAVAAGLAARQVVRAWGAVPWQADVAAGLAAMPVLAALAGPSFAAVALGVVLVVAIGVALAPDGALFPGRGGVLAAATTVLVAAALPAVAGAALVLVRGQDAGAALVLVLMVSAYEAADFIVGSGASNFVEGPLAGATTAIVVGLPMALLLVSPFDAANLVPLAFVAAMCPLGQVTASAVLPGAGASAPALRRIDSLLLLAPVWVAATAAF